MSIPINYVPEHLVDLINRRSDAEIAKPVSNKKRSAAVKEQGASKTVVSAYYLCSEDEEIIFFAGKFVSDYMSSFLYNTFNAMQCISLYPIYNTMLFSLYSVDNRE